MSKPGTKSPRTEFPKDTDGDADTRLPQAEGTKFIKDVNLDFVRGDVADISTAPTSRVFTRDYKKVGRSPDDQDLITDVLGRPPFRI